MMLATAFLAAHAQTTATWVGPASGGEWNTAANWDIGVPGSDANATTNAVIGKGTNVNYSVPMLAGGFGGLTNFGVLNVTTNGFNCTNIFMDVPGSQAKLFVTNGGVVNVAANLGFCSNSVVSVGAGGSLTVGGTLIVGCGTTGGTGSATAGSYGLMTNNGGTITAAATSLNPGNGSVTTSSYFLVNGGTNNLGNFSIAREPNPPTANASGLVINNGLVNMNSISIGNNSWGSVFINGGTVTNAGGFTLKMVSTTGRPSRLIQTAGLFVAATDTNVVAFNPSGNAAAENDYSVLGGTNIAGGFSFGTASGLGLVKVTNAASIYLGSQGMTWPGLGTTTVGISLNNGGLFGATTNWAGSVPMTNFSGASGVFTIQAADMAGNPQNIQMNGGLSGSGNFQKTGSGTLVLAGTNTFSGNMNVNVGLVAIGANGSIASSKIIVGSGATFDVSAVAGGFVLTNQTLSGSGVVTGAVLVAPGATLNPGSNALNGTLNFSNSLTEIGGAINHFDLAGAPNPGNDRVIIAGDLDVSGTNTVDIGGASLQSGSAYPLFQYGGNFNGGLTNFTVTSAIGVLTNDPVAKIVSFVPQATLRGPTNIVWLGNPANTNFDTETATNWLNAGAPDFFVPGDNVQFTDLGATNSPVNIVGTVAPGSVLFNSRSNYVFASIGSGVIGGTGGLTVSNTGTLTVLTTNTYTGATTISGGVLAVSQLANGLSPSAIGASSSDSASLVINGGVFDYYGPTVSIDRGAYLNSSNSIMDVSSNGTLTLNGTVAGVGGLVKIDNGTLVLAGVNTYTGATTVSNGVLTISVNATALGAGTVNLAGGTLSLSGVGGQPTFTSPVNVLTTGTIISGNNDILTGAWTCPTGAVLNVNISSGSTFSMAASMTNFLGTVQLGNSSGAFRFNATGGSGGDTAFGGQNSTYDLGTNNATLLARNSETINLGALQGGSGTFLTGQGSSGGTGLLTWVIGANTNNPSTTFSGTIKNTAANEVAAITKVGNGTLTLLGNDTYTGSTMVNSGVLALGFNPTNNSDATISGTTNITIAAGAAIDVSGRSNGTLPLASGQTLQGGGTLRGILDSTGGGTVSPGGGITGAVGTLTVTNGVNLGGTTWMKLNRSASPASDQLISSPGGPINYGGTLIVTNIGATLHAGDTFTLFSAAAYNNSFANIVLPNPNYYVWNTSQLAVNGSITLAAIIHPAITNVDFSQLAAGSITLKAANGAPGGSVTVLTSTNVTLPLGSWTTAATGSFDGNGAFTTPVTVNPAAPQQFFILSAQ